jgi:hypothetical protein
MGEMTTKSLLDMIQYHFKEDTIKIPDGILITPAEMENICMTSSNGRELEKQLISHHNNKIIKI